MPNPFDPIQEPNYRRRFLTGKQVVAQAAIGDPAQWTPDELDTIVDEMTGMLTLRLRGVVYAEDYARDTRTVPVTVTVHPTFHFHDPGPRIWWKPWARGADIARTVHTTEVVEVQVDITRIAWAKVPDAPKFPPNLGKPVTFVEYEGTQR